MDFASSSIDIMKERFYRTSDMIPSKIASLLIGLRNSSFITFLNVFFVSVGLSQFQAGLIVGLIQTLPIITGPMWCYISEVTKRRRVILFLLCIGGSFPLISAPWVSKYIYPQSKYACNNLTELNTTNNASLNQNMINRMNCEQRRNDSIQLLFQVLLIIGIISSMFLQSLQSYVNLIVVNIVKLNPRVSYGSQRVFTTIGVSLGSYFTGKAVNRYNRVDMSPYTAVFLFYLPYTLLLFPVGCYLIGQLETAEHDGLEDEIIPCNQGQSVCCEESRWQRLLKSDAVFYMASTLNLLFWHYSQVFVADVMKRSKSEMEFVFIISVVAEVIFFPFAAYVISKLQGPIPAIILGLVIHLVRSLLISHEMVFDLLVAVQIAGSMTFALSWCAIFERISKTPATLIRTIMTVLAGMMYVSAGSLIGNIVGGKVYDSYEGRKLFFMEAFVCLVWIAVAIVTLIKKLIMAFLGRNKLRTETYSKSYGAVRVQNTEFRKPIFLRVAPDGYDEIY